MPIIRRIRKAITHPSLILKYLLGKGILDWMDDRHYLQIVYRINMGRKLDLDHPRTFNEKLQWLKLYNRRPEYTVMVDKVKAKDYVAGIIGQEHIIPTLGVWDSPDDIDFDSLPNQFVLKCNHNSGTGMYICRDKSKMDVEKVKAGLRQGLKQNYYLHGREWPYKDVPRKVFAEQFMEDTSRPNLDDIMDYKFYCFDGEPRLVMVAGGRHSGDKRFGYYDTEWKPVNITWGAPRPDVEFERPADLDDMLRIARKLSTNLPHARIDLYNINKQVYFGEITFFDASGFERFEPDSYDAVMGAWLKLPDNQQTISGGGKLTAIQHVTLLVRNDGEVLQQISDDLRDYKFFCFDGKVKCFKIDYGRFVEHHANYYTPQGELLHFGEEVCMPQYDHVEFMPANLPEMIGYAEKLSQSIPFARIDFYSTNNQVYFGEITFFPASGMGPFIPDEWDTTLGDMIKI